MPSHMHGGARGERERDRDREAHSDISADSIERNGGVSDRFERNQMRWLDELRNRDAKIVQVTYPRTANNDKELSVMRGEFLEVNGQQSLLRLIIMSERPLTILFLLRRFSMTVVNGGKRVTVEELSRTYLIPS